LTVRSYILFWRVPYRRPCYHSFLYRFTTSSRLRLTEPLTI
jgi:hypothetical protein